MGQPMHSWPQAQNVSPVQHYQNIQAHPENDVYMSASGQTYSKNGSQQSKSSNNTGLIVAVVIIGLLVLGMGAFIVYWFIMDDGTETYPLTEKVKEVREAPSLDGVTLVGTNEGMPVKIFLNVNGNGTVSGLYVNMSLGTKMNLEGVWENHKIDMTGYYLKNTYRFVMECDLNANTYDLGNRYDGTLYITRPRPKDDMTGKLSMTVEPYEKPYEPLTFGTFMKRYKYNGGAYYNLLSKDEIRRKLTDLGFELTDTRTEWHDDYYAGPSYIVRIYTYSRTVDGSTTDVIIADDKYGEIPTQIYFPNFRDAEAFENSVKSGRIKKQPSGSYGRPGYDDYITIEGTTVRFIEESQC